MFGPSPHQRFNSAISARPAGVASPLSSAAPAASVAPVAGPVAPPKSAIGAGAGLPPAGPPQPGDWAVPSIPPNAHQPGWRDQMHTWRDARPDRPDGSRGWGRSPQMQAWRDQRPQRPEGMGGDRPHNSDGYDGHRDGTNRPQRPGGGNWGMNRPGMDISGHLARLRDLRGPK